MSALCKAVAPAQVQVTYSDQTPLPFRVEWSGELGPISFAGATPDDAAERALSAVFAHAGRGKTLLPEFSAIAKTLVRSNPIAPANTHPPVSEPLSQAGWVEAMRERIQDLEEHKPVRRANLRLVRA